MARNFLTPINLNKLELRNAVIQNLGTAPENPVVGQIYFDTEDSKIKVWTGAVWANVGSSQEEIEDFIAGLISAGDGIDVNYDDEEDEFVISNTGVLSLTGTADEIDVSASVGAVTISLPATINANISGIAASASYATSVAPGSVSLSTDTSGDYVATVAGTTNEIEVTGSGAGNAAVVVGLPNSVQITDDLTVGGNLTVSGSVVYLNVTELNVEDNIVTLNSGATGTPTLDAGIEVSRGASATVGVIWSETDDVWTLTNNGTNYHAITRKYSESVGDNSASAIVVTHNLGNRDVQVQVYTNSADYDTVETDVERTSENTVTVKFAVAPTTDQYRVVITG